MRRTGQAALNYAVLNLTELGCNIVSRSATLRHDPHTVRPFAAEPGRVGAVRRERSAGGHREADRRRHAERCSAKSVGNPAGNICDIEALADVAHRHGVPLDRRQHRCDADPAQADRLRRRHRGAFADQVHGRPRHDAGRRNRRRRQFPVAGPRATAFRCSASPTPPIMASSMSIVSVRPPMSRAAAASISAPPGRCWRR